MTTTTDRRRGPRGRIRYLCCACGTQRTASMNYHPTPPAGVQEPQGARWLQWLKCETCDAAGWHAGAASPEALSMAERATYAQPDEHGI